MRPGRCRPRPKSPHRQPSQRHQNLLARRRRAARNRRQSVSSKSSRKNGKTLGGEISMSTIAAGHRPPSDFLALTEAPRALFEFASFIALRPAMSFLPRGDGHPVLVLPGFLASDTSTIPLRNLLVDLGYDAVGWELGRNVHLTDSRVKGMSDALLAL